MPRFIYKAKVGPQEVKEGVVEAQTERAAVHKLSQMGYYPIEIKEELAHRLSTDSSFFYGRKKLSWRTLSEFMRQLSDLLASGLTVINALEVVGNQTENRHLKMIVGDMAVFVRDGGTFSDALARHPKVFSTIYVSMVKAGETGGMLEDVLNRLADYTETEDQIRSKIRAAMAYPVLMAIVGTLTITVLLTFVIPRLVAMFEDMGQALPLPTKILVSTSDFISHFGWIFIAAGVILGFILNRFSKTKEGKLALDRIKINIIATGTLINRHEIARFTRTLGTLLANGVPMITSLEVSASTLENEVFRQQIATVTKDVRQGDSFSKAVKKATVFVPFATNMIAVGDESGQLEKALLKVSEACERDIDRAMRVFTALLEPLIILIMGGIVGFIVISMLLPIFQINLMAR